MLKDGFTLMHEHMFIDLSKYKNNNLDCRLDAKEEMIEEMKKLYSKGVRNIVEVTNMGMGRDVKYVSDIQKESGINFIFATGFYKVPFLPDFVETMTIDELADLMVKDIEVGIDGTDIKAGIIGEIGTSLNEMKELEEKVFLSAIKAHKITKVPITTHTTLGTYGLKQIEMFKEHGVDLSRVVIGHVDLSGDIQYILSMLKEGVYVEFDTIGKNNYLADDLRVEMLKQIEKAGYIDKVFLSLDITRKSNMEYMGGIGYSYLFDVFLPKLREVGIKEESIEKMLISNPKKFFIGD
ncbi:phosphotriesterase-related protein [Streptobacillus felis]|uniref:Phosphotriesterase-related protein n=1 Tax=Streptobacillus felis TaxID=1384509 RepID=A0A7Z0PEL2_9FUSO|nr:phosphotriesterase-related protein [Streptobacillus felis]NYV27834.1 phosphotriesterase-related protein [Streptobacillus felis]